MRVLWVVNLLFPEAKASLTGKEENVCGSGGWLQASADMLAANSDVELAVACVNGLVGDLFRYEGKKIVYYVVPEGKGNVRFNKEYVPYWRRIFDDFLPDIVHLHGTELPHGLGLLEAMPGSIRSVVSIQGLISQIWKYYTDGMTSRDILASVTLRDIVYDMVRPRKLSGTLYTKKKNFKIKGRIEPLIFAKANAAIGRTRWDKANVLAMNPSIKYYHCDETLRDAFYEGRWCYDNCEPHTIFLSQAFYPFKGLHMLLKAMPLVMRSYPDAKVYVAGADILADKTVKEKLMQDGYARYIGKLMKRYGINKEQLVFTGPLDAEAMKQLYLKSNVFVSPSAIENSPNSVCEAQMLGVPCVASYVGGTPELVSDERSGYLYRFEDVEMLADAIKDIFAQSNAFDNSYEIGMAKSRHNKKRNLDQLLSIYLDILQP